MNRFFTTPGTKDGIYGPRVWVEFVDWESNPSIDTLQAIRTIHEEVKSKSMWKGHDKKGRIKDESVEFRSYEMHPTDGLSAKLFLLLEGWKEIPYPDNFDQII